MYYISEKDEAIKTIQRYLGLSESGNYDNKTKEGVLEFQEIQGITANGVVDNVTFEALRERYYTKEFGDNAASFDGLNRFPYQKNDFGNDISILNSHISEALKNYNYYDRMPKGAYFDIYTERAILRLREIFSLEGDNTVDKTFYARIKHEILTGGE